MSKRVRSRIRVFVAALVGAIVASHVFAHQAGAGTGTHCAPPRWGLKLLSVDSATGTSNHEAFWPPDAILASSSGQIHIWTAYSVLGQVGVVEAAP